MTDRSSSDRRPTTYGMLGTYPPTQCGLATFSSALMDSLRSPTDLPRIVSIVDTPESVPAAEVSHQWIRSNPAGAAGAAKALNRYDVAIIQHEYGIFPGRDGADVLEAMRHLRVPAVTVLHTVLVTPSAHQRAILEEIVRRSAAVVTMTQTGRDRLVAHYTVDAAKIKVIPHGAVDNRVPGETRSTSAEHRPTIVTWGLIGPGKGIEWAIEAMSRLTDLSPRPLYRIVGQTHPRVLERFGEDYRDSLIARAEALGVADCISFDARYQTKSELNRLVQQADLVLLPYDSRDQVTSGVLIEAVTAGKPVVSTGFPHAGELLASGAGLLVERQDPAGMADALRRVLTEPGLADAMAAEANRIAPSLLWPAVADGYRRLAAEALRPSRLAVSA